MGKLNTKELEMAALGAAVGSNCIPCLEWHYKKCREAGLTADEIREAFEMAVKVKNVPAGKINQTAQKLLEEE